MTELSAVEIAQRQRYLHLLQKVKENKALSTVELKELQKYERQMARKVTKQTTESKQYSSAKVKIPEYRPVKKKSLPISLVEVKSLAYECENLTQADALAKLKTSLAKILQKHPALKKSWERGQFLRNLKALASVVETVSEAARKLDLSGGDTLRDLIDSDPEVADIWNQTRLNTKIEAREALLQAARDGNQTAIRAVEGYLHEETKTSYIRTDIKRLTQTEIAEIFGVRRATINDWTKKSGCPRNNDRSYNLIDVIRWHTEYVQNQVAGKSLPADKLRDLKAEEKQLDLLQRKHDLLDRQEVIEGLVGRWQNIVGAFRYKTRELASMIHGQTVDNIQDILGRFFEDVQRECLNVPEFLYLPPEAAEALQGVFEKIRANEHSSQANSEAKESKGE